MKVGEYNVVVTSSVDEDELAAEVWNWKTDISDYDLCSVHIENDEPIIHLGPYPKSENGVWTVDYHTFKQIIAALDDFLVSIGYPPDKQKGDET